MASDALEVQEAQEEPLKHLPEVLAELLMLVIQDLNLRSRLPARSVLNGAHRAPAPSAPDR